MVTPVLVTKIFILPTRAELVQCSNLIDCINKGLDRKLTLQSAPTGFGKTTLVSHCRNNLCDNNKFNGNQIKVVWFSLGHDHNAPVLFEVLAPINWFNCVLVFGSFDSAMAGICLLIGMVALNPRVTLLYAQIFFIPSILLAGMMFPHEMLPTVVNKIAQRIPASEAMNAIKRLSMEGVADFNPWMSVELLYVSGLLGSGLTVNLLSLESRNAGQHGHPLMAVLCLVPLIFGMSVR